MNLCKKKGKRCCSEKTDNILLRSKGEVPANSFLSFFQPFFLLLYALIITLHTIVSRLSSLTSTYTRLVVFYNILLNEDITLQNLISFSHFSLTFIMFSFSFFMTFFSQSTRFFFSWPSLSLIYFSFSAI
jgi:hypothetical protein